MHDAVREEHVGLHDERGRVAERDVLAGGVDREGERLAGGGGVVLRAGEERGVHGRAVDELCARVSGCGRGARAGLTWLKRTALSAVRLDAKLCRVELAAPMAVLLGEKRVKPWKPTFSASKKVMSLVELVEAL